MVLFLKEHRFLIFVQCVQLFVIGLIVFLAGFHNISIIAYALFLGLFFFTIYLVYKYLKDKLLYEYLSSTYISLDDIHANLGNGHVAKAMYALLKKQYNLYEQELFESTKKQEQQFIFLDRWIHQMKTPVSVLELMIKDLDEPQLSDMREEVERIKTGLQTVLHMARLRMIERDFHVKQVDVKKLITDVNNENKRYYIRQQIYPHVEIDIDQPIVQSDEKWLHFVITQLVHNAVKYSSGKSEQIFIRVQRENARLMLEIEDFGIGISEADIGRIFKQFYTGESGRTYRESTGVGLYLVKEVLDYLGHHIEVESTVGKGTIFRIIF